MTPADNRIDATDLLLGLAPDDEADERPVRAMPLPAPAPKPPPEPAVPSAGGPDGKDVEGSVSGYLDYLSQLCRQLGVPDIVEEYFSPVVGRWTALHDEAERWRTAGKAAGEVTDSLGKPLGGLDAAWEGETADSFIAYMQKVGLAGNDMSDAMNSMADVLDKTADGIREIVTELAGVLADTAESSSQAMSAPVAGEERTRQHIDMMRKPTREFFESVRQVLEAFVKLCDGIDGAKAFEKVEMAHTFPAENWAAKIDIPAAPPSPDAKTDGAAAGPPPGGGAGVGSGSGGSGVPSGGGASVGGGGGAGVPAGGSPSSPLGPGAFTTVGEVPASAGGQTGGSAAAPAAAAGGRGPGGAAGAGMGGMMAPMMGAGAGGGGSQEHQSKSRVVGNPDDIFGALGDASPSVIGDEED
ncbi:MAG: WXG100 family type VII secretion target [Kibdelosporangium sp.]